MRLILRDIDRYSRGVLSKQQSRVLLVLSKYLLGMPLSDPLSICRSVRNHPPKTG